MSNTIRARRRADRRRRGSFRLSWNGKLLITVLLCGFAIFCAAVLLGNYLRSISEGISDSSGETEAQSEPVEVSGNVPIIIGKGISFKSILEASDTGTAGESDISEASKQYDSLSILLRYPSSAGKTDRVFDSGMPDTGMIVTYNSPVVQAVGAEVPGEVGIRDGISALHITGAGKYISGVFYVTYKDFTGEQRTKVRDYEIALIYELFEYGINEVVICGFGGSAEDVSEASEFVSDLRGRISKGSIGIAFPFDFYTGENAYSSMRNSNIGDAFFAVDLVSAEVPALMTPELVVYDRVRRIISVCVAYNVRVVVGCGENPDADSQVSEAIRGGAQNVQGVVKPTN